MIRNVAYVLLLLVFSLGASQNSSGQDSRSPGVNRMGPHQSIENKANLSNANDPKSVRALVDEVFNFPRTFPHLPSQLENVVKDRLVEAEILYKQGKRPGVEEQDIVESINNLAQKLGAPPHGETTRRQVRLLRMSLALAEPKFMGTGLARSGAAIGESVSTTMGPAQAIHLMGSLIDQKFTNPDFQVTPQEWEAVNRQKFIDKLQISQQQLAQARAKPNTSTTTVTVRTYSPEKRRQMEESLGRSISSLSLTDGLNLIDESFAKLRID